MNLPSTISVVDALYGSFNVIFSKWLDAAPRDSHLWELTKDKTAGDILEHDIYEIGEFFALADDIGTQSEAFLTAECMAYVRQQSSRSVIPRKLDNLIEKIANDINAKKDFKSLQPNDIFSPLSFRTAQFALSKTIIDVTQFDSFRDGLLQLAHLFTLHDGIFTTEENERLKQFDAALS